MQWSHGVFCWNELMSWDVERAKRFYADAIGWTFEPMDVPAGGAAMRTPFDIPDVGRIAIINVPGGAGIGRMTPAAG